MAQVYDAVLNNIFQINTTNTLYQKEVYCEICKITLSSLVVLNEHRLGKKHKRALQLLKGKMPTVCTVCELNFTTMNEFELHVTSQLHLEKAKVLGYLNPPSSMGNPESTGSMAGETTTSDVLKVTPEQVQELLKSSNNSFGNKKPKNQTFSCTSCCVQVTSQASFEAHLSSKRHRKNKHKFHTYPGISKESVKEKYVNNFVRAGTLGNEFTDKNVVFYCKKCDCKMQTKLQLEVHMSSNWHKENHTQEPEVTPSILRQPTLPSGIVSTPQLNFDNSAYGYGYRNWNAETYIYQAQKQLQEQHQKQQQSVAITNYNYSFPYYAAQVQVPPQPVAPPSSQLFPIPTNGIQSGSMLPPQPVQPPLMQPNLTDQIEHNFVTPPGTEDFGEVPYQGYTQ